MSPRPKPPAPAVPDPEFPDEVAVDDEAAPLQFRLDIAYSGRRLDQALAEALPQYSRSRLKAWLEAGRITVNGAAARPRALVAGGESVHVVPESAPRVTATPEPIPLDIRYTDEHVFVLHKPAGLVVHPGAGNGTGTLMNGLLHHDPALADLPRAGIVHRLDKETTGLMVVARTVIAQQRLVEMLSTHEVTREYEAVCVGVMTGGATVDAPIGRHETDRLRMAVRRDGREAITHYRVLERFRAHTYVRVQLETGRTHQIRVHLAHVGYPLAGDPTYGKRLVVPRNADTLVVEGLRAFKRQALHAAHLAFTHPVSGKPLAFDAGLPTDFADLLALLRGDVERAAAQDAALARR
jgi:23S rRNA pseudouridine1911/1915/1917 synthase